jgi:hypothetical protein
MLFPSRFVPIGTFAFRTNNWVLIAVLSGKPDMPTAFTFVSFQLYLCHSITHCVSLLTIYPLRSSVIYSYLLGYTQRVRIYTTYYIIPSR